MDEFPALKESYRQKSQLFINDGEGFRDVSETVGGGFALAKSSRGLALGDLDNDGDLDVVISNMDDAPTLLENRQRTGHHWARFQSKKEGANRFAIGARVTLRTKAGQQIREVRSGGSYVSQGDLRVHFGLGPNAGPVNVEVRLGQSRWRWTDLPVDRHTTLVLREQDRVKDGTRLRPAAATERGTVTTLYPDMNLFVHKYLASPAGPGEEELPKTLDFGGGSSSLESRNHHLVPLPGGERSASGVRQH